MLTLNEVKEEARNYFNGDVRRVLNIVSVAVACRGPKEAADFCRRLKRHPQVCLCSACRMGFYFRSGVFSVGGGGG